MITVPPHHQIAQPVSQRPANGRSALHFEQQPVQGLREKRPLKDLETHDVYFSASSSRAKIDRFFEEPAQQTLVFQFQPGAVGHVNPPPPLAVVLEKFPQPPLRVGFAWHEVDPHYRLQKLIYAPIQHQALFLETFGFDKLTPVPHQPFSIKRIALVEKTQEWIPLDKPTPKPAPTPPTAGLIGDPTVTQPLPEAETVSPVLPTDSTMVAALMTSAPVVVAEPATPVPPVLEQPPQSVGIIEKYHPWLDKMLSWVRGFVPGGRLGPLQLMENGDIHFFKWQFNPVRYLVNAAGKRVKLFHMARLDERTVVNVQESLPIPVQSEPGVPVRKVLKEQLLNEISKIEEQGYQLVEPKNPLPTAEAGASDVNPLSSNPFSLSPQPARPFDATFKAHLQQSQIQSAQMQPAQMQAAAAPSQLP